MDSGRRVVIAIGNEDLSSIRIVKESSDLECFDTKNVKICVLSISSHGQNGRAPKCIKGHEMRFILPQTPSSYRNAGAWRCDDCLRVFNDPERPDFVLMRQPRFVCTKCSSSRCTDCAEARQIEDEEEEEEEEKSSTTNDLDEMQCHFCKKRGDGLQGEGRLFRACTLKRKPIYLHEFCCLFAPEVYVDAETKKLVKVNRVVDSAQVRRLTCPLCRQKGTTLGCMECNASYHVLCALRHGVVFTGPPHWCFFCPKHKNCEQARTWGAKPGVFLKEWTDCFEDDQSRMVCEICHTMDIETNMIRCRSCRLAFHRDCLSEDIESEDSWQCAACSDEKDKDEEKEEEEEEGAVYDGDEEEEGELLLRDLDDETIPMSPAY